MPAYSLPSLVHRINCPDDLDPQEVHDGLLYLLALPEGPSRDVMLGSVLTGLLLRGPRPSEVEAAIRAATELDRASWEYLAPPPGMRLVGYTGSGKKTHKTINISSAAALIAAAGGAHVAKLGSRSASSRTGSRDFVDLVGARCTDIPPQAMVDIALDRAKSNQTGTVENKFKWSQILEAICDPNVYLMWVFVVLCNIPNGGILAVSIP